MTVKLIKDRRFFEFMLIAVVFGMTCVAAQLGGYKPVVLNLFYLPIILSGYFLGRNHACVLALFGVLTVTIVTALDPGSLAVSFTPLLGGLALAVWAAVLALAAILVGTLCDERAATVEELHQAYVGVVEVLSRYLQGGQPTIKARSIRVAEMSQLVAREMRMSRKEADDIRVGALLYDLGNVEITTKLIAKAVDTLEAASPDTGKHTFAGTELVHSLGSVLHGAMPLLMSQDQDLQGCFATEDDLHAGQLPLGARIIRAVRAYDALAGGGPGEPKTTPQNALKELRNDPSEDHDEHVLRAIERVVQHNAHTSVGEPAFA